MNPGFMFNFHAFYSYFVIVVFLQLLLIYFWIQQKWMNQNNDNPINSFEAFTNSHYD